MVDISRNPRLDPRSIPSFRPVQAGKVHDVLDVWGNTIKIRALPVGLIDNDKRNETIHVCVAVLYKRLQTLVQVAPKDTAVVVAQHGAAASASATPNFNRRRSVQTLK